VRPALRDGAWGFGLTMYCYGIGADEQRANQVWARALEQAVPVLIGAAESLFARPEEVRAEDAPDGTSR